MNKYSLISKFTEYNTSYDKTNAPETILVAGSQNVLIDGRNGKVRSAPGYTRLGIANTSLFPIRNAKTWHPSKGGDLPLRMYNDQWEVYLETVDAISISAWTSFGLRTGMSAAAIPRWDYIYDATEAEDLMVAVQGDPNLYEWNGAAAVIASVGSGSAISLVGNSASLTQFGAPTGTAPFTYDYNQAIGTALRALLKFSANPTDGQTLILNINASLVTVTFVALIGSNPGNVLIGATLANTITNLQGLLAAPGSTNANQVAFSSPNQTIIGYLTSAITTTVIKEGTTTFGQNRFYSTRNKVVTCARTGTDYTYTGGEYSQTLTGISDVTGLQAGDLLLQKIVTQTSKPLANRNNHTIGVFQNQAFVGSDEDENVLISKNTSYFDFSYSAPRVEGEGGILTLTDPTKGFGILAGTMIVFSGISAAFKVVYTQITVGTTLTESLTALPLKIGIRQGAYNQETIVPFGNALMYLSNEPAVLMIETVALADEPQLKALSNPIKPDMDAEDFTNACAIWYKNAYFLSAPANSHEYILEFLEDADSKLNRFWQPPQILPVRAYSIIDTFLHGHSNSVPETYKLFDGLSYTASDDSKLPIEAIAIMAYRSFGDRANYKNFDEIYVEGEISASTNDCLLNANYDFGGHTQTIEETINGSDEDILEESIGANSLAQESLGTDSLGGLLNPPADARKFRVIFEEAKEDFHEMNFMVSTNEVDRFWSILAIGINAKMSPRKDTFIRR